MFHWILSFLLIFPLYCGSLEEIYLRNNLSKAIPGDYLVTLQNKTYTVLFIKDHTPYDLKIEEISIPTYKVPPGLDWSAWILQKAPGNTSWICYQINLETARMTDCFSYTKNAHFDVAQADTFLTKLLNLKLSRVPNHKRKRIGPSLMGASDLRDLWNPKLIIHGQEIKGVHFDAWQTYWPNDGSDLSNKLIEIYIPEDNLCYPAYFPYWLQISGILGNAKVRIVDAGNVKD